jgi:hypothetical protein
MSYAKVIPRNGGYEEDNSRFLAGMTERKAKTKSGFHVGITGKNMKA